MTNNFFTIDQADSNPLSAWFLLRFNNVNSCLGGKCRRTIRTIVWM